MNRPAGAVSPVHVGVGALVVAGLTACSQSAITATVRTFNRPVQAAFVCLETATAIPRTLDDCTLDASGNSPPGLAMHGLVLQEARGEVAAVDLVSRVVIDSDPAIPGYTFVPIDPLPSAIVVPRTTPSCAFVASAGADTISALDLRVFRREGLASVVRHEPLELPGAPTAMVLEPSETALWVAMPERSSVARVAIDGCVFGPIEEIPLDTTIPAGLVGTSTDLGRYCPADPAVFAAAPLPTITPRDAMPLDTVARPFVLAVGRELLIGDRALPLVHRIDLATRAALTPFAVGAPIRALAVTPEVPVSYDPSSPIRERYVYAIDDQDGTVLALEYSDPASPTFGGVLPIGTGASTRPDRMPFLVGARTLEVLRPQYDELEPFERVCNPVDFGDAAGPTHSSLRGVFLAVGMTDATVRFADIFDSDAPCRGRVEGETADCGSTTESFVYVRRHRPRIGERRTTIGVTASDVSMIVNGATTRLTVDGAATAGPGLDAIPCPAGLSPIFATDEQRTRREGRVCGHADPHEAVSEIWSAAWQGPLSGTASSTGNFEMLDDSTVTLDARVDFCAAGVLGTDDVAAIGAGEPEAGITGDMIAITTTLPSSVTDDATCQAVAGIEGSNQSPRPIFIPIRAALGQPDGLREPYRGRLLFDLDAPVLDRTTAGLTLADVLRCFGDELVRFDVRARDAFSVIGSRTGQRHRVVRGTDGACEIDTTLPATRVARALPGRVYENALIAFRIPNAPAADATELRVTIGTVPAMLNIDVGAITTGAQRGLALPSDVVWNDVYQRMYVVDVERRGLIELTLQPLQYTSSRFE